MEHTTALGRREWLLGMAALATAAGCQGQTSETETAPASETHSGVPLRLLLVGTEAESETIRRAWGSLSFVSLDVAVISRDRGSLTQLSETLREEIKTADIVIYPLISMSELVDSQSIVAASDSGFESDESRLGKTHLGLLNGACRFGDRYFGVSLGSKVLALLSVDEVGELATWSDYHDWVESLDGKAAEPLAGGWAASSYLQRAASSVEDGWLFDVAKMIPLIDTDAYVEVLSQMRDTAALYEGTRKTPAEIWAGLRSGELKGGLGFEPSASDSQWGEMTADAESETERSAPLFEVSASDPPNELPSPRLLLDSLSPVASISDVCRQTKLSKQFLAWISGGENREAMMRQMDLMTPSRTPVGITSRNSAANDSAYDRWLTERLRTSLIRPGLQLIQGGRYYDSLNANVIRCLDGETSPTEALAEVATQWQSITSEVGLERQRAVWRRL